ncbi:UNVERIFIED_CONTAM: Glucomannan 4-beta-mannosyltransferase 1 [Sesamum radiatum]|uniref:glucomannan 4-beta-mannosyltransferase n=1 Tax=Sesamum radiatum TaxID=300843 RepID=A0AAW2LCH5_SESRA
MRNIVLLEPEVNGAYDPLRSLIYAWDCTRVPIIVPFLRIAVYICIAMSIMLFIERVYMAIVIVFVKCLGKKRYTKYQLDSIKEDLEKNKNYPMLLVQIPMFNEKEVYKLSIGAVCGLSWPSDRLIVQVLDDSTNEVLRALVELECRKWIEKGVNVKYETRNNRNGYKAGALREGLKKHYVEDCEFVVIFDADFQPEEDFLWRTIPYLLENPELALVQASLKAGCMTIVVCEVQSEIQKVYGVGTAGVWRIRALHDAGGWKDRTTVEDMDLAVRASLKGWKFLFVGDLALTDINSIAGHVDLLISSGKCSRKSLSVRSMHLLVFWILFENVMSLHRSKAAIIGLLEANRVNEWVVTEKLGNTMKQKYNARASKRSRSRIRERIHILELIVGMYLLHCAIYNMLFGHNHFFIYLLLQAGAFFIIGVGYVGTFVPN